MALHRRAEVNRTSSTGASFSPLSPAAIASPLRLAAEALAARGHAVRVLAGKSFQGWIEAHGLTAIPASVDTVDIMESDLGKAWVSRGTDPLAQPRILQLSEVPLHVPEFGLLRDQQIAQPQDLLLPPVELLQQLLTVGFRRDCLV